MFGLIRSSAMDANNIRHRNRINAAESVTSSHSLLRKLCCEIFSRTVKRFDGIKKVNFAVNLQILSLVKFNLLQGQKTGEDCNIELMSALSNGCIKFDEATMGYDRQQKKRALNISPDKICMTRPQHNLEPSKLNKSELVGIICSSLNSAVRRIAFLDHWQGFIEPRISYSELLRLSCRNLITAFNQNQDHTMSHCSHQSDDRILPVGVDNICHNMCAVTSGEALGITANPSCTFSFRFSQDCSDRNIGGLIENDATTIQTSLASFGVKADEKCTKPESLAADSNYADSLCYSFHTTAADKSGKDAVTQNSKDLDKNLSDFVSSSLSVNDATIAITDSSCQLADCPIRTQSTKTCDKKARRHRHRHMRLHSAQQCFGWRGHRFCRKQNRRQSKSRAKLQHKCRPQVAGDHHSSVSSDCADVGYLMEADVSQQEEDLNRSLKLSLSLSEPAEDVKYGEGRQTCLQVRDDETGDDDSLATDQYCSVTDDKETDDEVTDEENTGEEETDEDEAADDELNSESIQNEDITDEDTDEETVKKELSGKATGFASSRSNKTDLTSANIKTFCRSSFFISPSEIYSSDSSSDSDDEDDDLEVDAWDSYDHQSLNALSSGGICESFSFNGLYFPSSCSPVEAKLSLEELKDSYRTQLISTSSTPYALTVDCSGFDSSYDDIVFCDDQELHSVGKGDDEDMPLPNLSHLQNINAKWNHFYTMPREVEKPTENKKQVRFARDSSLVTTYAETTSEAEDYAAARKGPWEEYARDRGRFTRRMRDTAEQISWVLSPSHRNKVYQNLFSES